MADLVPSLTFTTRHLAQPASRQALRTLINQGLLPVEPLQDHAPHVDLVKWRLPGASILTGRLAGVRQRGEPGLPAAGDEDLFFGINVAGASLARQQRREIAVDAGDAMVVNLHAGPFTVLRPTPCRLIGVRLPRSIVPLHTPHASDPAMRLVPAHTPALQLLTRYVRTVLASPAPATRPLADAVVRHIAELIALSLHPTDCDPWPPAHSSGRTARLYAIKTDIERHLTTSSLSAASVAARHRITTRYLHKLFEGDTNTYSQFVLERRLDLAYSQLRDPRYSARTISSIAHSAGFGDLSYFNRTFRRRYDTTPSAVRQRVQ